MGAKHECEAITRAPGVLHEPGAEALRAAGFDDRKRLTLRIRCVDRRALDGASLRPHEQRVRSPGPEPLAAQAAGSRRNGLIANEVTFFGGHTDVRKAVGAGEFKLGLVNHYYYYLQKAEGSNVGIIFPDQSDGQIGLITNATAAAVLNGAPHVAAAQAFLDFLVSPEGQKLFAEQNYEYPLLPGVELHSDVQPMNNFRFADVDVVKAAENFEATFDLIEIVGLP